MTRLQPYTFVCAPQPAQWAATTALDVDMSQTIATYQRKRDLLIDSLADHYSIAQPGGAFYLFPRVPSGTATDFVARVKKRVAKTPVKKRTAAKSASARIGRRKPR